MLKVEMEEANENHGIKHERIRVKKRIKVKKKADPKKKLKKIAGRVLWIIVVLSFAYVLYTLVKESDIRDKNKSFFIPPVVKSLLNRITP